MCQYAALPPDLAAIVSGFMTVSIFELLDAFHAIAGPALSAVDAADPEACRGEIVVDDHQAKRSYAVVSACKQHLDNYFIF